MRILHLIYDHINNPWVGGGGAVRAYEIYRRLSERHDITIVCGKYPGATDYRKENVDFRFMGTSRNNYVLSTFCFAAKTAGYLKAHAAEYDTVVEDFAPYNPVFSFLWRKDVVLQLHHKEGINLMKRYSFMGFPFIFTERFYPGMFSRVICVSGASRTKFGVSKAVVIPNGIEGILEAFPDEDEYISFMGRLNIHNKGLDTLIEAMSSVQTRLRMAGRGRDEDLLDEEIRDHGSGEKVRFEGFLADKEKRSFIARSMFFVLPSRYEGQGIVILEAAACSKPVIVSDIPELKYAVDAGFGLSFKVGDAKDLAEKMNYLLRNQELRMEMGKKAREYARDFTWDKVAVEYEKYLLGIGKGATPAS